nr:DUF5069 domain-containing protein [Nitrospirota bacterium]
MDLRKQFPRSPRETLAGYVHLPRMADKCRATLAGTQSEYIYPCPMDRRLLDFAGMAAEQFTEAARSMTDTALAEWFKQTATAHSTAEVEQWSAEFLAWGPDSEEKRVYFNKLRDAVDPSRTDITAWADLLDLDENRPVPKRTANVGG